MKTKHLFLMGFILMLGMSSCTQRIADFTIVSTKNVPLEASKLEKAKIRVKGSDTGHMVYIIPVKYPNMKTAIDKAIEKYPGAVALADGVIKQSIWSVGLYGQTKFIVEGTPLYEDETKERNNNQSGESGETLVFFHEVKDGEKLSDIAASYGVKVAEILKWNNLSSVNVEKGTKLKILVK